MFVIGIVNAINISRSTIRKVVHFWCIFGVEASEGSKVGHRTEYGDRFQSKLVTPLKLLFNTKWAEVLLPALSSFFALDVPHGRASSAALDGRKSRTGRRSRGTTAFNMILAQLNRSQSIPCWPFVNRNSRPHLPACFHDLAGMNASICARR